MKQYLMLRFAFAVSLTSLFMTALAQPPTQSQVQSTTTPMQVQIKVTNVTAQSVLVNIRIPDRPGT